MTKKNILKYCIFALSLLSFFAAISVYAEEDCSKALIRALTEEGLIYTFGCYSLSLRLAPF